MIVVNVVMTPLNEYRIVATTRSVAQNTQETR